MLQVAAWTKAVLLRATPFLSNNRLLSTIGKKPPFQLTPIERGGGGGGGRGAYVDITNMALHYVALYIVNIHVYSYNSCVYLYV